MKKIFILLTLVLSMLLVTSCVTQIPDEKLDGINQPVTNADVVPPVTEDEKEETPPEKIEYNYSVTARDYASIDALSIEERANEFVSALCLKETEVLEMYIGGKINNLDSVKMDAYVKSVEGEIAKVGVTVYESEAAGLPVGEQEYLLNLGQNGVCYIAFFGTNEKYTEFNDQLDLNVSDDALIQEGYDFCNWSIRLGTITDIVDVYHNAKHTGRLDSPDGSEYDSYADLETITKYLHDRFGIEDINEHPEIKTKIYADKYDDRDNKFDKEMFFVSCGHGADASPWMFDGYSVDGNKYSYTFIFHSDFAYISPTLKSTYNFEKRDGCDILTFTGITTEKLGNEDVATYGF